MLNEAFRSIFSVVNGRMRLVCLWIGGSLKLHSAEGMEFTHHLSIEGEFSDIFWSFKAGLTLRAMNYLLWLIEKYVPATQIEHLLNEPIGKNCGTY